MNKTTTQQGFADLTQVDAKGFKGTPSLYSYSSNDEALKSYERSTPRAKCQGGVVEEGKCSLIKRELTKESDGQEVKFKYFTLIKEREDLKLQVEDCTRRFQKLESRLNLFFKTHAALSQKLDEVETAMKEKDVSEIEGVEAYDELELIADKIKKAGLALCDPYEAIGFRFDMCRDELINLNRKFESNELLIEQLEQDGIDLALIHKAECLEKDQEEGAVSEDECKECRFERELDFNVTEDEIVNSVTDRQEFKFKYSIFIKERDYLKLQLEGYNRRFEKLKMHRDLFNNTVEDLMQKRTKIEIALYDAKENKVDTSEIEDLELAYDHIVNATVALCDVNKFVNYQLDSIVDKLRSLGFKINGNSSLINYIVYDLDRNEVNVELENRVECLERGQVFRLMVDEVENLVSHRQLIVFKYAVLIDQRQYIESEIKTANIVYQGFDKAVKALYVRLELKKQALAKVMAQLSDAAENKIEDLEIAHLETTRNKIIRENSFLCEEYDTASLKLDCYSDEIGSLNRKLKELDDKLEVLQIDFILIESELASRPGFDLEDVQTRIDNYQLRVEEKLSNELLAVRSQELLLKTKEAILASSAKREECYIIYHLCKEVELKLNSSLK